MKFLEVKVLGGGVSIQDFVIVVIENPFGK